MAVADTGRAVAAAGKVLVTYNDAIANVTLCHPGRLNAITVAMWHSLTAVFTDLSANTRLRCVVISGDGGNFAAGADIREFPQQRADRAGVVRYHTQILAPALDAIASCQHPVIAQIEGVCVGGGLEIASRCDLRIAASSARFGVPINRLGFPMAPEEMRGLLALAGPAVTLELLLEGRVFDAAEAFSKGLLTRVLPDHKLRDDVMQTAQRLAVGAPLAARINKRTVARLRDSPQALTPADLQYMFDYAESRDHQEGVAAFLAGRKPIFSGD
jgi:enoyl-CoA hydratase/carnithine racemase